MKRDLNFFLTVNGILAIMCASIQCNDMLDVVAGVGSAGSAMCWTPPTLSLMAQYGIVPAITSTYLPRVAFDAAAATLSFYTPESKRNQTTLNVAICAGSALSLILSGPAIARAIRTHGLIDTTATMHALQAGIDVMQIIVSARRLYQLVTN